MLESVERMCLVLVGFTQFRSSRATGKLKSFFEALRVHVGRAAIVRVNSDLNPSEP